MQEHPDARSYRTKAILNFSDLSFIYNYSSPNGRYSQSSHDVDFDDVVRGLIVGSYTLLRLTS